MNDGIAVLAYNRPRCLAETLYSFREQSVQLPVHMFLDGPADDEALALGATGVGAIQVALRETFFNLFPKGFLHAYPKNLGTNRLTFAAIREMAERYDRFFVYEDDLVTTPFYHEEILWAMDKLEADERVVLINASGEHPHDTESVDKATYESLILMRHLYGWGTWSSRFDRLWDWIEEYEEVSKGEPVGRVDTESVWDWYRKHGANYRANAAQDSAIRFAVHRTGGVAVSLYPNHLKAIGVYGCCSEGDGYLFSHWPTLRLARHPVQNVRYDEQTILRIREEQARYFQCQRQC